jgi:hypothetical protein
VVQTGVLEIGIIPMENRSLCAKIVAKEEAASPLF